MHFPRLLQHQYNLPATDGLMFQRQQVLQPQRGGVAHEDDGLHRLCAWNQSLEFSSESTSLFVEQPHLLCRPRHGNCWQGLDSGDPSCTIVHQATSPSVAMNGTEDGEMGADGVASVSSQLVSDDLVDSLDAQICDRHVKPSNQTHGNFAVLVAGTHLVEVEGGILAGHHFEGPPLENTPNPRASRRSARVWGAGQTALIAAGTILFFLLPPRPAMAFLLGLISLCLWGQFVFLAWRILHDD